MLTLIQEPYETTPANQKLIITVSSDNVANAGFKYKVTFLPVSPYTEEIIFYVSPNPSDILVFDIAPLMDMRNVVSFDGVAIHAFIADEYVNEPEGLESGFNVIGLGVLEAWLVDGVLTDDPDIDGSTDIALNVWNAAYQISDGYRPNPSTRYALSGLTQNWLTDRRYNTHVNTQFLSAQSNIVQIPVREEDYGVMSILKLFAEDEIDSIVVTIFDSGGAPNSFIIDVSALDNFLHFPLYPANLNATSNIGWEKPSDYPGWRSIQIKAVELDLVTPCSVVYYLYNVEVYGQTDCKYDVVRLAWVGSGGSWEYFNFIKKNEESVNVERKRFQKIVGDYSSATFSFNTYDAGLTELTPIVEQFLDITSDWIQEGEFVYLKGLIVSKQVHWVQDDGSFIPVVVETNNYKMARERNGKLKNLELKLRLANNLVT